ncbi:two-component system response regulator FixJ [Labrys monachus]|uniref:Two-component system response regulator FixJ n=2 Tax=Labrys monachus TaxID=217067 RepID=A0ABU0FGV5_9HYPH|nr:two-component system response regulator FixJ [Labrys monachus]
MSPMPGNARVYVIDDDPAMRDSLDFLLGTAGFAVMLFDSASQFLQALPELGFGCVLTDVRMPGTDGIELLRQMRSAASRLPTIVMTGHGDIPLAVEAMKLGAADFVEKPFEDERLIGMIGSILRQAVESDRTSREQTALVSRIASLSPRERQVLDGLVAGLSNKMIAQEYDISPRTVEVYRANLMTKMQASNISELVKLAIRSGVLDT